jgi:hypothetical protein
VVPLIVGADVFTGISTTLVTLIVIACVPAFPVASVALRVRS